MDNQNIEVIYQYKYLGINVTSTGSRKEGVICAQGLLSKVIAGLLRRFHSVNLEIKIKLLNRMCPPIYGCGLRINRTDASINLRKMTVSYNYGLKKNLGFLKYFNNNYVCNVLNYLTFEHLMNLQTLQTYTSMKNRDSPCLVSLTLYFRRFSYMKRNLDHIFLIKYQIPDIEDNDLDACSYF